MKRVLALILALVMTMALVACGGDKPSSTPATSEKPATSSPATSTPATSTPATPDKPAEPEKPAEPKILKLPINGDVTSVFAQGTGHGYDTEIIGYITSRLYGTLPVDGKAIETSVLAEEEPIDVNGDGLTWNIKIRKDAKWENGESINADTFVYTMKVALDPKLVLYNSNGAANGYVEILNARAYVGQNAEGAPKVAWEDVGFKKVDDYTVQVTLASKSNKALVMRHFSSYATAPIYQPLFEKCLSADGITTTYGSSVDKIISSGAFSLTKWETGATVELAKNENFVLADMVKLDGINYRVIPDANTRIQMFFNGEIDQSNLTIATMKQYGEDPRVITTNTFYTCCLDICHTNTDEPILNNVNFRRALYWATDRGAIAKATNYIAGPALISPNAIADPATGVTFRQMAAQAGYEPDNYGYDPVKAKQYFDLALQEEGLTSVEITLLTVDTNAFIVLMNEFLQEEWQQIFGADKFKLVLEINPNRLPVMKSAAKGETNAYELGVTTNAISSSQYDPIRALMQYTAHDTNRNSPSNYQYLNDMYALADAGENRLNLELRNQMAMQMETWMIDNAITIPIWYQQSFAMLSDRVALVHGEYDPILGYGYTWCDIVQ